MSDVRGYMREIEELRDRLAGCERRAEKCGELALALAASNERLATVEAERDALRAEVDRKEATILKYQAGAVRREDMVDQIERLIEDRNHWKCMADKGSKTANRTINDLKEKFRRADNALVHSLAREARLRVALADFVALGEQYEWDRKMTGRALLMRNAREALADTPAKEAR